MSTLKGLLSKFEGLSPDPIKGLLELVGMSKNPTVQFSVALISIFAAIAIIKSIQVEAEFPLKSILIMLFLMMIIFVFSSLTKTGDLVVRVAGYVLMYTVVLTTSFLTLASASAIVFGKPESLARHLSKALDIENLVKTDECDISFDKKSLDCIFKSKGE